MATTPNTGRRGAQARSALAEALDAEKPVFPWPRTLPEEFRDIWTETVNTKTGEYWSRGDIPILEIYCRNAGDIRRLSTEIKDEGEIIFNANGNPVVNPKIVVRGYAESKLMTLCTKLRLQPSSRMDSKGEDGQLKKKGKAVRAAKVIGEDEDGLLAGASGVLQ
jgi:P27 family predicted phage terminase small subunit